MVARYSFSSSGVGKVTMSGESGVVGKGIGEFLGDGGKLDSEAGGGGRENGDRFPIRNSGVGQVVNCIYSSLVDNGIFYFRVIFLKTGMSSSGICLVEIGMSFSKRQLEEAPGLAVAH